MAVNKIVIIENHHKTDVWAAKKLYTPCNKNDIKKALTKLNLYFIDHTKKPAKAAQRVCITTAVHNLRAVSVNPVTRYIIVSKQPTAPPKSKQAIIKFFRLFILTAKNESTSIFTDSSKKAYKIVETTTPTKPVNTGGSIVSISSATVRTKIIKTIAINPNTKVASTCSILNSFTKKRHRAMPIIRGKKLNVSAKIKLIHYHTSIRNLLQ